MELKYKDIDKINQSSLKKILNSPQAYLTALKKQKEPTTEEHFIFGDVLDMLICGERKEFEEKYIIVEDDIKCSSTIKEIIDTFFDRTHPKDLPISLKDASKILLDICKIVGYGQSWKENTLIDKLMSEGTPYYNFLCKTINKKPILKSEYSKAVNCLMALRSGKFTSEYMKAGKDQEFLDKFIVQFSTEGFDIKGELDRVVIDHNKKTIQPIDFKSTGKSVYGFNYDFWKYRYDFQAAVYTKGLIKDSGMLELGKRGYKLLPFLYIVVEKDLINSPFCFLVNSEVLQIGLKGGFRDVRKLEGFYNALKRLSWHTDNNLWEFPVEHYNQKYLEITI